jgi:predicted ATPase
MPKRTASHPVPNLQVRWKMFRGFRDTGWLEIRPLTVLIGANGSGKTSLVAPLLLLKQTILSPDVLTSVVTRGPLIDVGTYSDMVYRHSTAEDIFFGLRFHTHRKEGSLKPLGTYPPGALELAFSSGDSPQDILLRSYVVLDMFTRHYLTRSRLPSRNYGIRGRLFKNLSDSERKALLASRPVNFLFNPSWALSDLYDARTKQDSTVKSRYTSSFQHYLNTVGFVNDEVGWLLRDLSFIGPIRDRPRRYYEMHGDIPRNVGSTGENTPHLLRHRYSSIRDDLNRWAQAFGIASAIQCKDISKDLFEVLLVSDPPKLTSNIVDSGFGASQLLPLIVQAITSTSGGLTVAEQPEIHLNPRLQSVLADLFAEMVKNGHHAIVETHSEHLLLRLRRLVAESSIKASDIALYFLERSGTETTVREVPIGPDGHVESGDWPAGFFEDTLRESLALAAAQH